MSSQFFFILEQVFHSTLIPCLLHSSEADMPQNPVDHHLRPNYPPIISLSLSRRGLFPTHFRSLIFCNKTRTPWAGGATRTPLLGNVKNVETLLFFRRHFATFPRLGCRCASLQCNSSNRSFKVSRPNYGPGQSPARKILIQNKTARQVLGKVAGRSQFRGKLRS